VFGLGEANKGCWWVHGVILEEMILPTLATPAMMLEWMDEEAFCRI
jgi:hypothetical protein